MPSLRPSLVFLHALILAGCWSPTPEIRHSPPLPNSFVNSVGMEFQRIPAGEFLFGYVSEERIDRPDRRQVPTRIPFDFYIGTTEVTIGHFREFVNDTGYKVDYSKSDFLFYQTNGHMSYTDDDFADAHHLPRSATGFSWDAPGWNVSDDHPVTRISSADALAFCRWLTEKEGRTYRLPTEEEWEYCCRAGTTSLYPDGKILEEFTKYENLGDESFIKHVQGPALHLRERDDGYAFSAPVKSFAPNSWGLFDMGGNVQELCRQSAEIIDESNKHWKRSEALIHRGSCWWYGSPMLMTASRRSRKGTGYPLPWAGFRVVCERFDK